MGLHYLNGTTPVHLFSSRQTGSYFCPVTKKSEQEVLLDLPVVDMTDLPLEQEDSLVLTTVVQSLETKYRAKENTLLASVQQKEASLEEHYQQLFEGFNERRAAYEAETKAYQDELHYLRTQQSESKKATEGYIEQIISLKQTVNALEEAVASKEDQIKKYDNQLLDAQAQLEKQDETHQEQEEKIAKDCQARIDECNQKYTDLTQIYNRETERLLREIDQIKIDYVQQQAKAEREQQIWLDDSKQKYTDLTKIYESETARLLREIDKIKAEYTQKQLKAEKTQHAQQKTIDMLMAARNDYRTELALLKQKVSSRDEALTKAKNKLRGRRRAHSG